MGISRKLVRTREFLVSFSPRYNFKSNLLTVSNNSFLSELMPFVNATLMQLLCALASTPFGGNFVFLKKKVIWILYYVHFLLKKKK